jgi:transposase
MTAVTLVLSIPVRKYGSGDGGDLIGEVRHDMVVPMLSRLRDYIRDHPPGQSSLGGRQKWVERNGMRSKAMANVRVESTVGSNGRSRKKKRVPHKSIRHVNPNAAGIDIGSEEHYVAVPKERDPVPVRRFSCLTPDLHKMARWLKECRIETVAMESTGVYWIPVAQVLEQHDIEVKLVDAYHVKSVPGRKTDVQDCQWLQELHSYGLLRAAFRPQQEIQVLRSYWRQRAQLVQSSARQIQLMQKALEQMNIQLHKVISDITGVTGSKIIRAILRGERDGATLARLRDCRIKSDEKTIAKALTGNYRDEHLFALKQAVELYDIYREKIAECDERLERYMATFETKADPKDLESKPKKKHRKMHRKNWPRFDLRAQLYRMTGVDLTLIDGIDVMTAYTVICECGYDMSAFPSEKHFASWSGLCPNNRITGGKVLRTKTRKVRNRVAVALRVAAQSLLRSQTALGAYYRRMRTRLGAPKAITATAHKLAILVYRMLKHGEDYVDKGKEYYEQRYRERRIRNLVRQARQMGCELLILEPDEGVS